MKNYFRFYSEKSHRISIYKHLRKIWLFKLLQTSKENASSAFSGEKSSVQTQRGAEKVINNITTVLSIAFFVVAILAVILR